MFSIFTDILNGIKLIGEYVLYGSEECVNGVLAGFGVLVNAASELLPALPAPFAPPTIVAWLNWFYPVGALVSAATGFLSLYVTFLGVRWVFRKAGIL